MEENIVCPWCGCRSISDPEYDSPDYSCTLQCQECGESFKLTVTTTTAYSTERIDGEPS